MKYKFLYFKSSLVKIEINWKLKKRVFFRKRLKTTSFFVKSLRACKESVWVRKNRDKKR